MVYISYVHMVYPDIKQIILNNQCGYIYTNFNQVAQKISFSTVLMRLADFLVPQIRDEVGNTLKI